MLRKFIERFNKSVAKRVNARKELNVPISVSLMADRETGRLQMPVPKQTVSGETLDLSETGILFALPSIRLGGYYLAGEGRRLNAELSLPGAKVQMQIVGMRYEQTRDINDSITQFLIGAKIVQMTPENAEIYDNFLKHGGKSAGKLFHLNPEKVK